MICKDTGIVCNYVCSAKIHEFVLRPKRESCQACQHASIASIRLSTKFTPLSYVSTYGYDRIIIHHSTDLDFDSVPLLYMYVHGKDKIELLLFSQ